MACSGIIAKGDKALIKKSKKGRPRSENPMVHTAVVLPRDMLEWLRRDAEASGQGLSAEIRAQLQVNYLMMKTKTKDDPETSSLLAAIRHLANFLARDLGKKWHEHAYALAAFKAGVASFLARYHPEGDERVRPDTRVAGEPDDPPDVVGRTHARNIGIARHEDEPDYDLIHDAQAENGKND
jgi:hypothetical protein